ncbi:MAG: aerobic carbon-monoxide dehydrogenase small subunit [Thermoleophilaceae bacterium]|nr:aerobic carbon-monoxide dehydrogenase small subunit [Thermoleophilaceae bacterium]
MEAREVTLSVNGRERTSRVEDRKLLLDTLREDLGLTGAHAGCEHGVCGACTVLLDGEPVRSCLMLAAQAEGHQIETVESLSNGKEMSTLQQSFVDNLGLQCGFCTPGMLLTAKVLLEENPNPTEAEVREAISANLCRCTGYDGIITSILAAAGANGGGER